MDPDVRNEFKTTPLQVCAAKNESKYATDIIRLLLDRGADIQAKNVYKSNSLHFASFNVSKHALDVMKLLIDKGLDPNEVDIWSATALHDVGRWSRGKYVTDMLRLLVSRGSDMYGKNFNGTTVLHYAVDSASCQLIDNIHVLIDEGLSPNSKNDAGSTPLHFCVKHGKSACIVDVIQALEDRGANLYARNNNMYGLLHYAVQNETEQSFEIIEMLIEKGLDPNSTCRNGLTPLQLCAEKNGSEYAADIIRVLRPRRRFTGSRS